MTTPIDQQNPHHVSDRLLAVRKALAEVVALRDCDGIIKADVISLRFAGIDVASGKHTKADVAKRGVTVRDCVRRALMAVSKDFLWYLKTQLENEEASLEALLRSLLNAAAPKVESTQE